jgi:hypothetical protein
LAARRLIAILLVLLFLSSLAAALAPVQEGVNTESTSTSTSTTTETPAVEGEPADPRLIDQSVDASSRRPVVIEAQPGDELTLRVTSRTPGTVELAGIGPTEDVGPRQPAFFDVLLRDAGSFAVRFLETRRKIAEIRVVEPGDETGR